MTQPEEITNRNVTEMHNLASRPSSPTEPKPTSQTTNDNEYFITEYSSLIKDDRFKIQKLVPLKKNCCKFTFYIILNIITACIINLFIAWFPKMKLCLIYSVCPLDQATHMLVYEPDGSLSISEIEKIPYGSINFEDPLSHQPIREFNLNINLDSQYKSLLLIKHKLYDYIYNENTNSFNGLKYFIKTTQDKFHQTFINGLDHDEVVFHKSIFGECDIDIKIHSTWQILLNELTDPFYLFQLYSIILWYCNEYEAYSTVIVVLTIISLITSVCETRANLVQLHKMSKYSCQVNLYRKDETGNLVSTAVESTELVPGDLFEVPEDGLSMPCDAILLNGTVIINESMLTGESTPIVKTHMPSIEGVEFNTTEPTTSEKYLLYAGTKIVQKRALPNCKCLAVCYSTSFKTIKGNLIQEILFPKKTEENFQRDSTKYIIFMSCLCVIGFGISLKFLIVDAEYAAVDIVLKFLDLITTTVPPSLPACISVGITYALYRLKKEQIICIARERVNVSGKVNVICFDKTGTLTEDHLDIHGYVPVKIKKDKIFEFREFSNDGSGYSLAVFDHYKTKVSNNSYHDKNKDIQQLYVECLACCHGITIVKDKLIGDPIDVKMFEGIGWTLQENTTSSNQSDSDAQQNEINNNAYDPLITSYVRPKEETNLNTKLHKDENNENEDMIIKSHYEIGIVRRFDFSSKLQRMTTIVKNVNEEYFKVFCKGSPEKIKDLCKKESIPDNFNDLLNSYTSKGYRVLAMATKSIKMNFTQSQQISREFVESNMIFLGLLIVHNKLKEVTPDTIKQLDNADIRMVMATGDNILTAISVSKECKLVAPNTIIYTCNIEKDENEKEVLTWSKVDDYDDNKNQEGLTDGNVVDGNGDNKLTLNNNNNKDEIKLDTSAFSDDYPAEEIKGNENSIFVNKTTISTEDDHTLVNDSQGNFNNKNNESMNTNSNVSLNINNDNTSFALDGNDNYAIALTGPTFEKLYALNEKFLKKKNQKLLSHHKTFRQILTNGIIFARMAPEHKALLVQSFKQEQCTVLMCGDGANDCSALKAADVGVSLSPEEASIAAHFTSKVPDISCLLKLLREGKGSLATSIQTFKYMMLYSLIQFFIVTLLLIFGSYLSDFQFLTSDLFIIFPLAFFMALTAPYPTLTHHYPISSLLTFPIIVSILLQTIITFAFQLGGRMVLAATNTWYERDCELDEESGDVVPCVDNSVYFLISHFQYLTCAIAFSVSKPFRKGLYTNIWLMIYLVLIYFYSIWITVYCDDWSRNLFTLTEFEHKNFEFYLFAVCCVNFVVSIAAEWGILACVRTCWENRTIKKYMKNVRDHIADPEKNKEFSIFEYQRVLFANRRVLMEEEEKKKKKEEKEKEKKKEEEEKEMEMKNIKDNENAVTINDGGV